MRHPSRPYPRTIGIISSRGTLDLSAIRRWALLFPEIEHIIVYSPNVQNNISFEGKPSLEYVSGEDGKEELCRIFRGLLADSNGSVIEEDIELHLLHKIEPDYLIIVGSCRLPDVLLWQSVYSELYFASKLTRKHDFVRAVREFQKRNRRFGR